MNQLPENSLRIYDVTLVTSYLSYNRIRVHPELPDGSRSFSNKFTISFIVSVINPFPT